MRACKWLSLQQCGLQLLDLRSSHAEVQHHMFFTPPYCATVMRPLSAQTCAPLLVWLCMPSMPLPSSAADFPAGLICCRRGCSQPHQQCKP